MSERNGIRFTIPLFISLPPEHNEPWSISKTDLTLNRSFTMKGLPERLAERLGANKVVEGRVARAQKMSEKGPIDHPLRPRLG
jgi:hypothetical protein